MKKLLLILFLVLGLVGSAFAAFPTTGILDNFNRGNEGPPMTGWTDNLNGFKVLSSTCVSGSVPTDDVSYFTNPSFGPDCEVYTTVVTKQLVNGQYIELLTRLSGDLTPSVKYDGYGVYYTENTTGTDIIGLEVAVGGAFTPLITFNQEISAGDSFGMSAIGNILTVYYKPSGGSWTSLGTYDTSGDTNKITIGGKLGIGASVGTMVIDDFGGGAIGGGGTSSTFDANLLAGD